MADLRVSISEKEMFDIIQDALGFGAFIDFGATGRRYRWRPFGGEVEVDEIAEFPLLDVLDRARVLDNDALTEAAKDGIVRMLQEDGNRLKRLIQETAEAMRAEMLAEPLEGEITSAG